MIRMMTRADIPAVQQILAVSPEAAQWAPNFEKRTGPPDSTAWVAEEKGKVVGVAVIRAAADEAELLNLAVSPEFRRTGVGSELVSAAEASARQSGGAKMFLEVRFSNLAAIAFYTALGFTRGGVRKKYYRDPEEDALVLSKVLD